MHELSGVQEDFFWHGLPYPDRPHFTAFSYAALDAAYRNPELFASSEDGTGADFDAAPERAEQHAVDGRHAAPPLSRAGAAVVRPGEGRMVDAQLDPGDGRTR